MRQFAVASSGLAEFSCPSCRFTTQFCPCCGRQLAGPASVDTTNDHCLHNHPKSRGPHHVLHTVSDSSLFSPLPVMDKKARRPGDTVNRSKISRDPKQAFPALDQDVLEWAQKQTRLPHRPLSAFEVFCHEVTCRADERASRGAAMQNAQIDLSSNNSSGSENTNHTDLNPEVEDTLRQHSSLAQKWFYTDQKHREECERRAKTWSDRWKDPISASGAATDAAGVVTKMPSFHHSAGSVPFHPLSGCSALPDLPSTGNSGAASLQIQVSGKKRDAKLNAHVTSYQLFRAANKGKFSSQVDAVQAWRALSPNSKTPFDEAAAALRVQRLLQHNVKAAKG